jgi:GNAT superfamily N-acetyltransferase
MTGLPVIRPATTSDLEALVRLRVALFRELHVRDEDELTWDELADATRQYLAAKLPRGEFLAWVAEADGAIVSTSGLVFFERPPSPHHLAGLDAYVMNMFTLPAWRGRGLASALLRELIAYVRTTNARRIWLSASEAGRPIYAAAGFVQAESAMEMFW